MRAGALPGAALTAPVWQSIVPQLVPRQDLSPAVAANSVGVNVSRAVGPALGGMMAARIGIAAPFWFNAISNLAVLGALLWWHPPKKGARLPVERFGGSSRCLLFVRKRLLGTPSTRRAYSDCWWPRSVWLPPRGHRCRRGGRRFGIALVESETWTRPACGSWNVRHRLGDGPVRVCPQCANGVGRKRCCGSILDSSLGKPQRVRPGRAARLGSRPWTCDLCHRVLRLPDLGKCDLGPSGRNDWPARSAYYRGAWSSRGNSRDLALEATDRCRARPHAVDALARPYRCFRHRARTRTDTGDDRVPDRSERSRAVPCGAREARP